MTDLGSIILPELNSLKIQDSHEEVILTQINRAYSLLWLKTAKLASQNYLRRIVIKEITGDLHNEEK